jgi:hypothetical protein
MAVPHAAAPTATATARIAATGDRVRPTVTTGAATVPGIRR